MKTIKSNQFHSFQNDHQKALLQKYAALLALKFHHYYFIFVFLLAKLETKLRIRYLLKQVFYFELYSYISMSSIIKLFA
jgi:hypothetical protein